MATIPFRILSLNGGGVRGVFQAVALKNLQKELEYPLYKYFDLICGTSTGAIIALALSIGIEPERIVELYKQRSEKIFKSKFLSSIKRGPRYDSSALKNELVNIFGNTKLKDVKTKILVTSSCLDQFSHRVFSSFHENHFFDKELSLVDIALASSAAPTFFEPVRPDGQERSYLDGGLWANSPSLVAVIWANRFLHIPLQTLRVLSIGTGSFPKGALLDNFKNYRPLSRNTIGSIFEVMFAAQESSAEFHTKELVGASNYYKINFQFDKDIHLDEAEDANKKLPALAEIVVNDNSIEIMQFLEKEIEVKIIEKKIKDTLVPDELIEASGLTGFFPSRRYYMYRGKLPASDIDTYVNTAQKSLIMVSINLMTGLTFNNLCKILKGKLENKNFNFTAKISLLNPLKADLIFSISPVLSKSKEQLFESIMDTIIQLKNFKNSLSTDSQKRFEIRVHNAIPFGSAIIKDHKESYGRIQIETKPYKAVLNDSFAFEVAPIGSSGLFGTLLESYNKLLEDGNTIEDINLLDKRSSDIKKME